MGHSDALIRCAHQQHIPYALFFSIHIPYAAAKNTELIIFLISPSAYSVYEQKLKFHHHHHHHRCIPSIINRLDFLGNIEDSLYTLVKRVLRIQELQSEDFIEKSKSSEF
jgi:hypothetical protein